MMSAQKSAKPSKPSNQAAPSKSPFVSSSSSLSSHLAMVELKQKILNSLSKLADRDTHQIALEDLEKIIQSLSNDGVSIFLNCLYDAANDPKPAVKREAVRLFPALCAAYTDSTGTHLTKIIAHIVKRLKDTDSQVRDACLDAVGSLAGLYSKGGHSYSGDGVVSLFVKPLFEAMSENNKAAQGGAALGLAKIVECAADQPLSTFQKLVSRVCKYLNSPNFMAKAYLLQVVSSLSQVGAITSQSFEQLQQSIHVCLCSSDWATRKAAADSLIILGLKTSPITEETAVCTVKVLEACRFDKIKPVRESMNEALQLWKKISGQVDGSSDEQKISSQDGDISESADASNKKDIPNTCNGEIEKAEKDQSSALSPSDPNFRGKGNNVLDKAVGILKKKASALSEKELNPEFFQKLETRVSGEVMLPRRCVNALNLEIENERTSFNCHPGDPRNSDHMESSRSSGLSEAFVNNKGNWLAIQRQLSLLEKQQAHLMNMLQGFMGGSHEIMVTLENRVQGLERVVEEMIQDLSVSSSERGGPSLASGEGSSGRYLNRYIGLPDYSSGKFGRVSERFPRGPSWRPVASNSWNFNAYSRNGTASSRRVGPSDAENEADRSVSQRAWEKGAGAGAGTVRFGEGPSARSVWKASKDEATLEAIRVAGEENGGVARGARVAIPEMTAEALGDDGAIQDRNPVWTSWSNAMDALHNGDLNSAYVEVLSIGDDELLVKLMDKSGPVIDQLTNEVASEVISALSQFLMDQNLFDLCLIWVQQLADVVMELGGDVVSIPMEVKREILVNLHDLSCSVELGEDWEGAAPDQVLLQLGELICRILGNSSSSTPIE